MTVTLDHYLAAHEAMYGHFNDLCAALSTEDLAVPSLCPDWDVRGVLGHVIGVERVLDGWQPSTDNPPPFGRLSAFATEISQVAPAAVAARVSQVTASRLAHLRSLDPEIVEAPSVTPTGVGTYGDFLRVRVFDMWVHARDIAIPMGQELADDGIAAQLALDEVAGAIGYIVGKKIGLPDRHSIMFHITGSAQRDIAVVVDGRALPVDIVAAPDVEITADLDTFIMLAAGRLDPDQPIQAGRISWTGNQQWGERAARNLAYTT